jgi:hypothetical protein
MFKSLNRSRIALGIAIFILGQQVIFYLKERAHRGSEFTAAALLVGMAFMFSSGFLTKRYPVNRQLTGLLVAWIMVSLFYMYFNIRPDERATIDFFREHVNFVFALAFMFMLTYIPDEVRPHFALMAALVTLMGNLLLFYSLYTNPNYVFGMRATIFYGDGENGGNPHVAARNGFAGFIASMILLNRNNLLIKLLAFVNAALSLAAIVMAQTRTMLLCFMVVTALFLFFNANKRSIGAFTRSLTRPSNLLFICIVGAATYAALFKTSLYNLLESYAINFFNSFVGAMTTAVGGSRPGEGDASASYRVTSFGYFREMVVGRPHLLIFGDGYKRIHLDVPFLEAINDCGIPGLVTFGGFLFIGLRESLKVMRRPTDEMSTFLAYFFIPTFVAAFSGGRPFDTSFLFAFAPLARFLNPSRSATPAVANQPTRTLTPHSAA